MLHLFIIFICVLSFLSFIFAYNADLAVKFKFFVDRKVLNASSHGYFERKLLNDYPYDLTNTYNCSGSIKEKPLHIFFLSDSIDRFGVDDFCYLTRGKLTLWNTTDFTYKHGSAPSITCTVGNLILNYLNLYGSSPTGPYTNNNVNSPSDPYCDTSLRITQGFKYIRQRYPEPDYILLRTDMWDLRELNEKYIQGNDTGIFTSALEKRYQNYLWDYDFLRNLAPNSYIGTHTVPIITWAINVHFYLTSHVRQISLNHPWIFNFDWNLLLQPLTDPKVYLRDRHHPDVFNNHHFFTFMISTIQEWEKKTCAM